MARTMTGDRLSALIEVSSGQVVRSFDEHGKSSWKMLGGGEANGRGLGWLSRFGYLTVVEMEGMSEHPVVLSEQGEALMGESMVSVDKILKEQV